MTHLRLLPSFGICIVPAFLSLAACAGTPANQEEISAALRALREADTAMAAGDPEAALSSLDRTAKIKSALPAAERGRLELTFGEANLRFARQLRSRNGNGSIIEACYLDAEAALGRAEGILTDSTRPCLLLGQTFLDQGKYAKAVEAAERAIEKITARDGEQSESEDLVEPLILRVRARIPELAELRRASEGEESDEPDEDTVEFGGKILADISRAQGLDGARPEPYQLASVTFRWLGQFGNAMRSLEDGVRADPSHHAHHNALHELYGNQEAYLELAGLYKKLVREIRPRSADVLWYSAWAEYSLAWSYRNKGDRRSADERYASAEKTFMECAALQPKYEERCKVRRAICAVAKARMALDEGDEKVGEAELDRAFSITPEIAAEDANGYDKYADHFRKSYRGGIYALGARFMGMGGGRLREARRFFRKVTERHPTWGPAWNNLGLACRDLGVAVERSGDEAAAKTLYEESFAAYKHAATHSPDDPRIQNDCGLMLVYHLHRDHDFAIAQFEKAIELGTAQLEDLPEAKNDEESAIRDQRNFLEEAVGDAWQNWGLVFDQRGALEEALGKYRKAVAFYPRARRMSARRIPEIERTLAKKRGDGAGKSGKANGKQSHLLLLPAVAVALHFPTDDTIVEALAKLDAGDAESALDLVEPLLKTRSGDAEVWYVAGRGSLLFAKQRMSQGAQGANENLIDAIARLEKADALTRKLAGGSATIGNRIHIDPVQHLVDAQVQKGEAAAGWDAGKRHLTHLDSLGIEFERPRLMRLMISIADAGTRKVIADLQAKKDAAKDIAKVRSVITQTVADLEKVAAGKRVDPKALAAAAGGTVDLLALFRTWANLEEWAGRGVAAIRAWGRGARLVPVAERGGYLNGMLATVGRTGGSDAALREIDDLLKASRDATTVWYRGYAGVLRGNELRMNSKPEAAPAAYAQARKDLAAATAKNAQFANSSSWWAAMSLNSEGWCAQGKGNAAAAKKLWLAALAKHAGVVEQKDALGQSVKSGILALGGTHYRAQEYVAGAELMEEFLKALKKDDFDALNNIGFFMREHALRLDDEVSRRDAFRKSWRAYKRAAAAAPENARILNDTALIDVYYLQENRKEAEALLRKAIEVGQDQLDNEPPAAEAALQALEEAVGDARMNLGLLLIDVPAKWDEAERELRKSLEYYPGQARATRRHLRRLNRERRDARRKKEEGKGKGKG